MVAMLNGVALRAGQKLVIADMLTQGRSEVCCNRCNRFRLTCGVRVAAESAWKLSVRSLPERTDRKVASVVSISGRPRDLVQVGRGQN